MLSPNPLSLLCALLLCLPLAIVFTTTTTTTTIPSSTTTTILSSTTTTTTKATPITRNTTTVSTTTASRLILDPPIPNLTTSFYGQQHHHPSNTTHQPTTPPPPASVEIDVDDDEEEKELFRLASRAKRKPTNPRKIAFMFLTTTPLPFAPLWESYFNKTPKTLFNIYVHAAPNPNTTYNPPFTGVFHNRLIPSKPTSRFSPTLAAAARRLLAQALIHDRSNYMFLLLSPSCIPLHSFNFTYRTLATSRKSFIEILPNETSSYGRWAARGEDAMLPEVKLEEFRIGSQFWALTRKHARLVVGDTTLWSKFRLPCVRWYTCYPEENYFPTLMAMWDPKGCVHATLTHVDWSGREDGHPRTYEPEEVGPDLIRRLRMDRPRYGDGDGDGDDDGGGDGDGGRRRRHDPFLFARKFAPEALQPLMGITDSVIFRD